jgi:predicted ATPase
VQEITLSPLVPEDLGQLVADALRCEPERARPLAELVHRKTAGNPFFAIHFLSALAEEGLISFDHVAAQWSWDMPRIQAKGYTGNVVDLMIAKLTRLPEKTQKALEQLACLGNIAGIAPLSIIQGISEAEVHANLQEAVGQELIFPVNVRIDSSMIAFRKLPMR